MKIATAGNLNFDSLCFLNVVTRDEFYLDYHREEYERFYPLLSEGVKAGVKALAARRGSTMLWPVFALLVSALDGHEGRDLAEMLSAHDEIREGIGRSPYSFTDEEFDGLFCALNEVVLPFVNELKDIGFVKYWH
ncbi:MAG: hypothetical protein LBE35_07100, partial [Clostridiales bacterium]|nr:hypothetical protein [Clostridiales bacterium]